MLTRITLILTLILSALMASSSWGTPIPGSVLWFDASDIDGDGNSGNNPLLGAAVSTWVDKAGTVQGVQNAVQASGSLQPTYTPNAQNGQAAITFTSDLLVAPSLSLGTFTYFTAFRGTVGSGVGIVFERSVTANSNSGEYFVDTTGNTFRVTRGANSFGREYVANWGKSATLLTSAYRFDGTVAGSTLHVNGAQVALSGGGADPGTGVVTDSLYIGQRSGGVAAFTGDIAELVAYSSTLKNAEVNIIDNYMSSKYDSPMAGNDFYAGDTVGNGNYDFNVFGIGREADGTVSTGTYGTGLTLTENSASLAVGEYVLAGRDSSNSTNMVATDLLGSGMTSRLERIWYVDKTGLVDATITFNLGDLGLTAGGSYSLLYRNGTAGNFTNLGLVSSISGNDVSFAVPNATLLDGFYTLGMQVPEPSTLTMLGLGGIGLLVRRRRRLLTSRGLQSS